MFGRKNKEEAQEDIYETLPEYDFERDGSLVSPRVLSLSQTAKNGRNSRSILD